MPSGSRMGGSLRIIVLFWTGFSGARREPPPVRGHAEHKPARLGATCPRSSASGRRSTVSSAAGPWRSCGRISWMRLEPRGDCAGQAADGRQHSNPGASSCGGRKRGTPKEALGRSRGGISTKIHLRVNGTGLPMRTGITPGQDSDDTGYGLVMADTLPQTAQEIKTIEKRRLLHRQDAAWTETRTSPPLRSKSSDDEQ